MGVERIRIGVLDLSAPAREPLARMLPELRDALRTASWPDGRGGVIQIARIDLGVIAPGTSRQALAQRFAVLAQAAVTARASASLPVPQAAALHWPDRVELLAAVALLIGQLAPLPWWAERALSAAPPGPAPYRLAAAAVRMAQAAGGEALAALVLRVAELGGQRAILTALAAPLLAAGTSRFPTLIRQLAPAPPHRPSPEPGTFLPPVQPQSQPAPRSIPLAALMPYLPPPQARTVTALIRAAILPPEALAALVLLALSGQRGPGAVAEIARRILDPSLPAATRPFREPRPVTTLSPRPHPQPPDVVKPATAPPPHRRKRPAPEPPVLPLPEERTRLGGLPMLINLLHLAGAEPVDSALDAGFCLRLIHGFLNRAAPGTAPDPLILALPALPDLPLTLPRDPAPLLPAPWLLALAPPALALARVPGLPWLRAVLLPGGRGCLGLVDAAGLRRLRASKRLIRAAPIPREMIGPALLLGWQILLARCCRELTGDTWRRMICRDAYLATSTTHIDITLDIDSIRLPERRSGLDRTPGWVPLLGRVVTLHFERFQKPLKAPDHAQ